MTFYVYIMANRRNGTLYIGVTNSLARRLEEHRTGKFEGFTKRRKISRVVHIETFETALEATTREKQMKNWQRKWKLDLIEKDNPAWRDLYVDLNK